MAEVWHMEDEELEGKCNCVFCQIKNVVDGDEQMSAEEFIRMLSEGAESPEELFLKFQTEGEMAAMELAEQSMDESIDMSTRIWAATFAGTTMQKLMLNQLKFMTMRIEENSELLADIFGTDVPTEVVVRNLETGEEVVLKGGGDDQGLQTDS